MDINKIYTPELYKIQSKLKCRPCEYSVIMYNEIEKLYKQRQANFLRAANLGHGY